MNRLLCSSVSLFVSFVVHKRGSASLAARELVYAFCSIFRFVKVAVARNVTTSEFVVVVASPVQVL